MFDLSLSLSYISRSQVFAAPMFSSNAADLKLQVRICGLEAKERIIVRYDAKIFCLPFSSPSGLLQAAVDFAYYDNAAKEAIQVGQQVLY